MSLDLQNIFIAGIKKIFDDHNAIKGRVIWSDVANYANMSSGNLSSIISGKRNFSEEKMKSISDFFGVSHIDVIKIGFNEINKVDVQVAGTEPDVALPGYEKRETQLALPDYTDPSPPNNTHTLHENVIKRFQQKDLALKLNEKLVELETINPHALETIYDHIRWKIDDELRKAGQERVRQMSGTPTDTHHMKRA